MTISWADFRDGILDRRFDVAIEEFAFDANYVTTFVEKSSLETLANIVMNAAVNAVCVEGEHELVALSTRLVGSEMDVTSKHERAYVSLSYGQPVFGFGLAVGPTITRLTKHRCSLEDLVRSLPTFEALNRALFAPPSSEPSEQLPSLATALGLHRRIHRVGVSFRLRIRLHQFITEPRREATNLDLADKLIRTTLPSGSEHPERQAPPAGLSPERLYRADATLGFAKSIDNREYEVWVKYEGPHNVTKKDVDLKYTIRSVGGTPEGEQLLDYETPVVRFYRDIVLNRFMPALFHDIRISERL